MNQSNFNPSNLSGGYANSPPININNGLSACFDWFTATFDCCYFSDLQFQNSKSTQFVNKILSLCGSSKKYCDFKTERGRNNYKYRISIDEGINLFFCGPDKGSGVESTMLDITGAGCRIIEKFEHGWFDILFWLLSQSSSITRLDCAIDDFEGKFYTLSDLLYDVKNKNYTSKWRNEPTINGTPDGEYFQGLTIQFGIRGSSATILRVYDKLREQLSKKGEIKVDTDYWVRWEMQFSDRALQIVQNYLASTLNDDLSFVELVSGLLFSFLQIREPGDGPKSDWPINKKYLDFIGHVAKIETVGKVLNNDYSIDRKVNWFNTSCFKALMAIYMTYGHDETERWLIHGIINELEFYEDSTFNEINNKRKNLNYHVLTHDDIVKKQADLNFNFELPFILSNKKFKKKSRLKNE